MAALLLAKALVAATAGLQLHLLPAAVSCVVLAVAALFWPPWPGIRSRSFLFGRRPDEGELFRPIGTAGAATTGCASTSPLPHFIVLCIGMGAVLHVEPLVAAAEVDLHPVIVVCAVISFAALVNWAVLSLNFAVIAVGSSNLAHSAFIALVVRMSPKSTNSSTASDGEGKESHPAAATPPIAEAQLPRAATVAAPTVRAHQSHLARAAFVVLAALMSASWFLEPFAAAAAELRLPWPAVVAILVFFATCFYASIHIFCSFFLPRPLPAAAPQWGVAGIAAVGAGVMACLVTGSGSLYGYATARF